MIMLKVNKIKNYYFIGLQMKYEGGAFNISDTNIESFFIYNKLKLL